MLVAALASLFAGLAGSWLLSGAVWVPGLALLGLGAALLYWPRSFWALPAPGELSAPARQWGVIGVTLLAAAFRCWRLDQPGLWGDDAINGLLAFDILDGHVRSPFQIVQHSHSSFHALSNYPIAAAFALFGADLWTLRLPGVLMGIAGAPLLYGIAAPLFGARVGLLAAAFYASSPPQLTHAKQLVQIITGEFVLLVGLCLLVRGLVHQRRWITVAAGLPLALCVYTYHSTRIAPVIAGVFAVAWLLTASPPPHTSPPPRSGGGSGWGRPLAAGLVLFLLALLPAALGYLHDPSALTQRVNATSIWVVMRDRQSLAPLWDALWRTLAMFHYQQGPEYHWFGLGFDPAFNLVLGALLTHGLVASLRGWRQPRHLLLLTWVLVGLAPGVLSGGAPRLYRSLLATPPLYVWAALPLAALLGAARATGTRALAALVALLVVAVPVIDAQYYFYRVYTHPVFAWFHGERMVQMARALREQGPGWTGYLFADTFDAQHETFRFLARAWQLDLRDAGSLAEVAPPRELPAGGALYLFSEAALPVADAVRILYPGNRMTRHFEPTLHNWAFDRWWPLGRWPEPARTTFATLAVPRDALEQSYDQPPIGLLGEFTVGQRVIRRREPYPFYGFLPPTFRQPLRARFSGRLTLPAPGGTWLEIETNAAGPRLTLDHTPIPQRRPLSAGAHDFDLELETAPEHLQLRLYWTRPGHPRELIPPRAFSPPPAE
ncbi:MAG: glycosyltransferase family 39 protein [Deltaproteobacteria bacterium]|nr:glycosyltransferase family 39 protein [Deltaproteobacteria bacterium]